MKFKNTFYNWLTNRFILIIRNEENFAIKTTLRFNYARLIVLGVSICALIFVLSFYLITTILSRWFNPEHVQMETSRRIIKLAAKVDSLGMEVSKKDSYILHFKELINNKSDKRLEKNDQKDNLKDHQAVKIDIITPEDSTLRKKFEGEVITESFNDSFKKSLKGIFFYEPVNGVVVQRYNLKKGVKGIKISCAEGERVKNLIEGIVLHISSEKNNNQVFIFSEKYNILANYQFKGQSIIREGEMADGGECIGILGTENPELYLETRFEGKMVNPEMFVQF